MQLEQLYEDYRSLLFNLAYRMLGSVSDAEDIVQDVFLTLHQQDIHKVKHFKAYLIKTTTNRCLNLLSSTRRKREEYIGPWLPEPLIDPREPAALTEHNEAVSYALLVLMEQLSPMERAVFILREGLEFEYETIAEMLDKTASNCRKIMSRAKQKLPDKSPVIAPKQKSTPLVEAFIDAANTGNFKSFIQMLVEEASLISDGGGKVRSALKPIRSRLRILRFLEGVSRKGAFQGSFLPISLNGEPSLLLIKNGQTKMAFCFARNPGNFKVTHIYMVMNPDKLKKLQGVSQNHP
ncbi:RNA polymerase sigma-70 factor [Melghirimyces algeriensis]|uniref:RNA polymerase sigma-70 factor, ECF subfamily n=1 Tax=Melghirimyces algeriensis TaxID=910412 RepID=A0A521BF26_9BACL|nr:RNA polymerase sigma-70 factor [Melghirimyces algeriensis]SMO45682.1 RNA polymerase sigma-70 factor, ECF subfamily [Melghirimyces algeriensis]